MTHMIDRLSEAIFNYASYLGGAHTLVGGKGGGSVGEGADRLPLTREFSRASLDHCTCSIANVPEAHELCRAIPLEMKHQFEYTLGHLLFDASSLPGFLIPSRPHPLRILSSSCRNG